MNLSESIKKIREQSVLPEALANAPQLREIDCGITMFSTGSGKPSILFFPSATEKPLVREWLKSLNIPVKRSLNTNGKFYYWDITMNQWEVSFAGMEEVVSTVEL